MDVECVNIARHQIRLYRLEEDEAKFCFVFVELGVKWVFSFFKMLINWINVTVYAEQWAKLLMLLPQADRAIMEALERENTPTSATLANPYSQMHLANKSASSGNKSQKEFVLSAKAKILAVYGLAHLQDKNFKLAAEKFMMVRC